MPWMSAKRKADILGSFPCTLHTPWLSTCCALKAEMLPRAAWDLSGPLTEEQGLEKVPDVSGTNSLSLSV